MIVAIALSMTMVLGTHALASEPENLDDSIRAGINEYVSEQYSSLSSVEQGEVGRLPVFFVAGR